MFTTVDVCMIMRNEEDMLPRALKSVVDWADGIICIDTGSTDKTIEIAESYGARVYHSPWQNNFSFHRNESISKSNADWVCILDCDEEIISDMSHFKERLKLIHPSVSALVVNISEVSDERETTSWLGMRFFRKSSGIHYKNAVHNKAVFEGGSAATDIKMNHYGYSLDPDKMEKKRARTEALLQERLEKDPKDHAALYYMCQMRIGQKRYEEAEEYGVKFFKCVPVGPEDFQFYGVMYFYMAWNALHLGDGNKAFSWAEKGLEFYPEDIDLNYTMARIGYQAKMDEILKKHGEKYLELLPSVRNRGNHDTDQFANHMDIEDWFNRTVYCIDEAAEKNINTFMEALN